MTWVFSVSLVWRQALVAVAQGGLDVVGTAPAVLSQWRRAVFVGITTGRSGAVSSDLSRHQLWE